MKKKICLLFIMIISLFLFSGRVDAVAAWIECDYEGYGGIKEGKPLVLFGGYDEKLSSSHYRLVYNYNATLNSGLIGDFPYFAGEWYKNANDASRNDGSGEKYSKDEAMQMIRNGICPSVINEGDGYSFVFGGTSEALNVVNLETQYVMMRGNILYNSDVSSEGNYRYIVIDENGRWLIYDGEGNHLVLKYDTLLSHVEYFSGTYAPGPIMYWSGFEYLNKYKSDFFKISKYGINNDFNYFGPSNNDSHIMFDNGNHKKLLTDQLDVWISNNSKNKVDSFSNLSLLVETSKELNEKFSSKDISKIDVDVVNDFVENLNDFISVLENDNIEYPMCVTNETTTNALSSAYNCTMKYFLEEGNLKFDNIPESFKKLVIEDIKKYLIDDGFFIEPSNTDLKNILIAVTYIDGSSVNLGLDSEKISNLRSILEQYCDSKNVTIVIDCDSLFSEELRNKIDFYMSIFRIAIPIILIGFGILDFCKAVFGSDDEMKKAKTKFIKRIGIAILIFLVPIFVNLLLDLANTVWGNIYSNCDLF